MEKTTEIYQALLNFFPFQATEIQKKAMVYLDRFLVSVKPKCCFILKGYAGTGKTTLISALVRYLHSVGQKPVLMAPTGRAAKVFSSYSKQSAFTIHKMIYALEKQTNGVSKYVLKKNGWKRTIFIVDEASMISDQGGLVKTGWQSSSLLDDLMEFVYSGVECKLILIGDTAQLPPVHMEISPALRLSQMESLFAITAAELELDEVLRQKSHSGILINATMLRQQLKREEVMAPFLDLRDCADIFAIDSYTFRDQLEQEFRNYDENQVIVLTRSNKSSNQFNQQIRNIVFGREEFIEAGDKIMVVRNNYYWLGEDPKASFIANGDMAELLSIQKIEDKYGYRFADVNIRLLDYDHGPELSVKVMLDTILEDGPSLPENKRKELAILISEDYPTFDNAKSRFEALAKDPYFNALEIKFAYSVTCHKSQGGQWPVVFVDLGYLTEERIDRNFVRWLYTAITRSSEKVFLVNFPDFLFKTS